MKEIIVGKNILDKVGLTLIEFLVALAILALVLFPIYEFLRQGALSWQIGENKTEVVQNARIGLDKMCDEIKHAKEFYSINLREVRFWWKDLNDDDIADANEIITFKWNAAPGDDLTRQFDSEPSPTPLANYLNDFQLNFFDISGAQTTDPNAVYFLTATLQIKKTVQGDDFICTMRKGVYPRNIIL